jgi:hypothetical protein
MDDGEQVEYGPGDFAIMPAGHDAWIAGTRIGWSSTGGASPAPANPKA